MHAKFEKFQGQENLADDDPIQASSLDPQSQIIQEEDEEEDDRWF